MHASTTCHAKKISSGTEIARIQDKGERQDARQDVHKTSSCCRGKQVLADLLMKLILDHKAGNHPLATGQ